MRIEKIREILNKELDNDILEKQKEFEENVKDNENITLALERLYNIIISNRYSDGEEDIYTFIIDRKKLSKELLDIINLYFYCCENNIKAFEEKNSIYIIVEAHYHS